MAIGIFGGTFNPIHLGHLRIAEAARRQLGLRRLVFVPSYRPPHKRPEHLAEARHRLAMIRLALRGHPNLKVSDLEIRRGGDSYTIQTVLAFRELIPRGEELYFVMGADSLRELPLWREAGKLTELCRFAVADRHAGLADRHAGLADRPETRSAISRLIKRLARRHRLRVRYRRVRLDPQAVSSRAIRAQLRAGRSSGYWLPPLVADYIYRYRLYGARPPSGLSKVSDRQERRPSKPASRPGGGG